MLSGAARKYKGARLERRIKTTLEAGGWFVIKAGGSLGAYDLIAFSKDVELFIQAKCNRKPPPAEMLEMYRVAKQLSCMHRKFQVWIKKDRDSQYYILDILNEGAKLEDIRQQTDA